MEQTHTHHQAPRSHRPGVTCHRSGPTHGSGDRAARLQDPTPKPSGPPGVGRHRSPQSAWGAQEETPGDASGLPQLTNFLGREARDAPSLPAGGVTAALSCGLKEPLSSPRGP